MRFMCTFTIGIFDIRSGWQHQGIPISTVIHCRVLDTGDVGVVIGLEDMLNELARELIMRITASTGVGIVPRVLSVATTRL